MAAAAIQHLATAISGGQARQHPRPLSAAAAATSRSGDKTSAIAYFRGLPRSAAATTRAEQDDHPDLPASSSDYLRLTRTAGLDRPP